MFGLGKRKQKEKSNFLDVFKKFYDLRKDAKDITGKTIQSWNVYPKLEMGKQLGSNTNRAEIHLYFTDGTVLKLDTSDCDIKISLSDVE